MGKGRDLASYLQLSLIPFKSPYYAFNLLNTVTGKVYLATGKFQTPNFLKTLLTLAPYSFASTSLSKPHAPPSRGAEWRFMNNLHSDNCFNYLSIIYSVPHFRTTAPTRIAVRVLRGFVLGPAFFNLFVDDLSGTLLQSTKHSLYADNFVTLSSSPYS